jgi:ferric-dicitrate binding protein FerR (iron transport regulator)
MEKNKQITDEEWGAIAKDLYEEADGSELPAAWKQTMQKDEITETARKIDLYCSLKKFDTKSAFQKVKDQALLKQKKSFRIWRNKAFLKIAAVVTFALIVASAGFFAGSRQRENNQQAGIVVDQYGNSRIQLSDGSVVTLNHDTKVNYPDKFDAGTREVQIEGEAFFEVRPDPARPFIIRAGKATIKVLGTSFNVNAYPENGEVEVVVETGKVRVTKMTNTTPVAGELILDPGDRGVLTGTSGELKKSRNENPNFLSWKTREFVFNKTSLKEVIQQLNKVYQVKVKAEDPQVERLRITARFEGRSLDFILKVISMTHDLKVVQTEENYILQKSS